MLRIKWSNACTFRAVRSPPRWLRIAFDFSWSFVTFYHPVYIPFNPLLLHSDLFRFKYILSIYHGSNKKLKISGASSNKHSLLSDVRGPQLLLGRCHFCRAEPHVLTPGLKKQPLLGTSCSCRRRKRVSGGKICPPTLRAFPWNWHCYFTHGAWVRIARPSQSVGQGSTLYLRESLKATGGLGVCYFPRAQNKTIYCNQAPFRFHLIYGNNFIL